MNGSLRDVDACEQAFALHSLHQEHRKKTFMFVKLTDSALQSIEDYLASHDSTTGRTTAPTIQFEANRNHGVISLPAVKGAGNGAANRYAFNLSRVDFDGPQGSYECLRQPSSSPFDPQIHSLGCMMYKLQIQAGEDIYQKTKVKMAVAEQDAKKHSTKVIKETGPNVGRKVKLKKTLLPSVIVSSSTSVYENNSRPSVIGASNALSSYSSMPNSLRSSQSTSSSSHSLSSISANSLNSTTVNQSAPSKPPVLPVNAELMRKPFRERIIHLLALRPYKKLELLARLNREGIREKDKKGLGTLLSSIAMLKDNSYHLHRGAWQEVQPEDWQFYTPEERELVRKRNPFTQMINEPGTPNGSSSNVNNGVTTTTGSSASTTAPATNGKSEPNLISPLSDSASVHASPSPPASINSGAVCNSPLNKRLLDVPVAYTTAGSKKQRISHHVSSFAAAGSSLVANVGSASSQTHGQRSRTSPNSQSNHGVSSLSSKPLHSSAYHELINGWASKPKSPADAQPSGSLINNNNSDRLQPEPRHTFARSLGETIASSAPTSLESRSNNNSSYFGAGTHPSSSSIGHHRDYHRDHHNSNSSNGRSNGHRENHHPQLHNRSNNSAANGSLCSTPNSSPDSGTGSQDGCLSTGSSRSSTCGAVDAQPDYVIKYCSISNSEQRACYKSDFNCEYEEYKQLHHYLDKNALKFGQLEQKLRKAAEGSELWNVSKPKFIPSLIAFSRALMPFWVLIYRMLTFPFPHLNLFFNLFSFCSHCRHSRSSALTLLGLDCFLDFVQIQDNRC